ncbi:MAG TPA: phosphoribosyltransferase family protein [Pyrinomonadaceae bacterium]|nr:phosphoribosyltransferase family protein [Pyrinomonadaceae bacterium]
MLLTRFYDALLTVAYPQACRVCGGSVEERSLGIACKSCWEATRVFNGAEIICWKCGALSPGMAISADIRKDVRCRRCDSDSFTAARAVGVYEKALRASVLESKRCPHLAPLLIQLLLGVAQHEPLNEATRIIAVPLHDKRLKERGFNQATVIAEALAGRLQLPLDEVSLTRTRGSEKYRAGLDQKGRRDTVDGAFQVRYPRFIENENVLLVDDVFTTGATVNACAEALLKAKAREVLVLTIARGKS